MSDIELKTDGLVKLLKAFKGKLPMARVGILGNAPRADKAPSEISHESLMRRAVDKSGGKSKKTVLTTNAEIGARWEFDQKTKRSFLRVPLIDHLNIRLNKAGAFTQAAMDEIVKTGSVLPYVEKIGMIGLDIVIGGFETGGYGKWVPSNMDRKKNKQTLVETQQLMRSVVTDVK